MANAFVVLDRVGNGYKMVNPDRPADGLMFIQRFALTAVATLSTAVGWANYSAAIVGFESNANIQDMYMVRDLSDGLWYIACTSITGFVHVMFMHRSLCTDATATTKA